jgi:transposase
MRIAGRAPAPPLFTGQPHHQRESADLDEIADLDQLIAPLVKELAPEMPERVGLGVQDTGQLLVTAGDDPRPARQRSRLGDALRFGAAARLVGQDPTPPPQPAAATAPPTAPWTWPPSAALRLDPRPQAYAARRQADGLTKRETQRCLKRYIAREAYHLLT